MHQTASMSNAISVGRLRFRSIAALAAVLIVAVAVPALTYSYIGHTRPAIRDLALATLRQAQGRLEGSRGVTNGVAVQTVRPSDASVGFTAVGEAPALVALGALLLGVATAVRRLGT